MARHTSPNRKRIDDAYPVRLKIAIPSNGLGNQLSDIHAWLFLNLGEGQSALLPARGLYYEAMAIYFRSLTDAQAFLTAFPSLELADGVEHAGLPRPTII